MWSRALTSGASSNITPMSLTSLTVAGITWPGSKCIWGWNKQSEQHPCYMDRGLCYKALYTTLTHAYLHDNDNLIVYAEIAITDLLLRRCGEEGFTRHLVSTHIIDAHVLHRDYVTRLKPKIRGLTNLQNNNEFMTTKKLEDVQYSWFFSKHAFLKFLRI